MLVDASAPDADHVHIALGHGLQQRPVFRLAQRRDERGGGNPARAAGEDRPAVQDEPEETRSRLVEIGRLVQLDHADADLGGAPVELRVALQEADLQRVEARRAKIVSPPKARRHKGEGRGGVRTLERRAGCRRDNAVRIGQSNVGDIGAGAADVGGHRKANLGPMMIGRQGQRREMDAVEAGRTMHGEFNRTPQAYRRQAGTPIPAPTELGLAHKVALAVQHSRREERQRWRRPILQTVGRRVEPHRQFIGALGANVVGDVERVGAEHIVALAEHLAVQPDRGERVEAEEAERQALAGRDRRRGEVAAPPPLPLGNPGALGFILVGERMGQVARHMKRKIGVSGRGNLHPVGGNGVVVERARGKARAHIEVLHPPPTKHRAFPPGPRWTP